MTAKHEAAFLGIDLGGTNVKVGCFDNDLNLLSKASDPTPKSIDGIVDVMETVGHRAMEEAGVNADILRAVGIGSPGTIDRKDGIVEAVPTMKFFKDVPLRNLVSARFGGIPATLENDANAAAWGEFVCGAGKDSDDMVMITLGTGIGGAVICSDRIIHGATGAAGELGHMIVFPGGDLCDCGQHGCAEAYGSASTTVRRARAALGAGEESSLTDAGDFDCRELYQHARKADPLALRITEEAAQALGRLCVNITHFTDPAQILFSGGMTMEGDYLFDAIRTEFDKQIWKLRKETVRIEPATLGTDAGMTGCAAMAKELYEAVEA